MTSTGTILNSPEGLPPTERWESFALLDEYDARLNVGMFDNDTAAVRAEILRRMTGGGRR